MRYKRDSQGRVNAVVYAKPYGVDVYLIAALIIGVHAAMIIAHFYNKDMGVAIPDSLSAIQGQIEKLAMAYMAIRVQKQSNYAHQRVNAIVNPEGLSPIPK